MIDIKDKNGLVIEVGQIVKMKGQDCFLDGWGSPPQFDFSY